MIDMWALLEVGLLLVIALLIWWWIRPKNK